MLRKKNHLIIALLLVLAIPVVAHYLITQTTLLQTIRCQKHAILHWVQGNYRTAVAGFMLVYIIITALSIPEAAVLSTSGGFLFGTIPATCYVCIAGTIGATIAFLLIRFFIGTKIQERYHAKLAPLNAAFAKHGVLYLLIIHMVPGVPFVLINMFAALTRVSLFNFVWTTILGLIPGTLFYTFVGHQFTLFNTKVFSKNTYLMGIVGVFILLFIGRLVVIRIARLYKMQD